MTILGVDVDNCSQEEIHEKVDEFLREGTYHRIATVNPEFLVEVDRNPAFRESLRSADLRIADGSGIALAFRLRGAKLSSRYPGADLMEYLLAKAEQENYNVFFAVRDDGLSSLKDIDRVLKRRYPNLSFRVNEYDVKKWMMQNARGDKCHNIYSEIFKNQPAILFCNFGAPEQEFFLGSLRENPGSIRLAMGVGGALDFLTGRQKRAPRWMRVIGFEWLWRLFLKPTRIGRIGNAIFVFPWLLLKEKAFSKNWKRRRNG